MSQGLASVKYDALGPLVVNSDGVSDIYPYSGPRPRPLNKMIESLHTLDLSHTTVQTLSRITNWPNMTPAEKERTFRVLVARNKYVYCRIVGKDFFDF